MREPSASRQLALGLLLAASIVVSGGVVAAHVHDGGNAGEPCALCIVGESDLPPTPGDTPPAATAATSAVHALPSAHGGREPRATSGPRAPPTSTH